MDHHWIVIKGILLFILFLDAVVRQGACNKTRPEMLLLVKVDHTHVVLSNLIISGLFCCDDRSVDKSYLRLAHLWNR